jgi:Ser-tRNA(Ala) deacylase AlaX
LNEEFKQKQLKLDDYNEQLKHIHDTPNKIEIHMEVLKKVYMSNKVSNVDTLNSLNDQVKKFFKEVNGDISDIIRQKIMELEGEIENISRKLISLRSLILTGVNEIMKPENVEKKMCSVCFDNEINMALVPCGHTFCKGCSEIDRSRYAKCPQCRTQINARIKIYFSI